MPTPLKGTDKPSAADPHVTALELLRSGRNPFANQVAAVGTADDSLLSGLPDFASSQLAELMEIVRSYRAGRPDTRVFPVVGDRGSGKTHLLFSLREALRRQAAETGEDSLLVIVERLSPGMDAIDYLLWQIVNPLIDQRGEGGRLVRVIAGRLTARLLAEALRSLPLHQRVELIPVEGFFARLGFGRATTTRHRLDAIDSVIQTCDAKNPTPDSIREACDLAGLKSEKALNAVEHHLERTESKDVGGWFRKELYGSLARFALLNDRTRFEDLHIAGFDEAPANVKNAGNLTRQLLRAWLELASVLGVPVVLVFDQLEDYLRSPNREQEKLNQHFFTEATSRFINELRNVCILVFSEEGMWNDLLTNIDPAIAHRLSQHFDLAGRAAKNRLTMPDKVDPYLLPKLIRNRVAHRFPDLDFGELPDGFPFDDADLTRFGKEPNIRMLLRRAATRYDEIVHKPAGEKKPPAPKPRPDLRQRLADLWAEKVATVANELGSEMSFSTTFIPKVQTALDGWFQALVAAGITGAGPWHKVELFTDTKKEQYGYLNLVRTDGPNAKGIGIAAWLGENRSRPHDLRQRLDFFKKNQCPLKTLILLRADGKAALSGETATEYEKAKRAGRDVRIHQYEAKHMHALLAFTPWHQAATAEVQAAKEADAAVELVFRHYLADLSKDLLESVDNWRQPVPASALW